MKLVKIVIMLSAFGVSSVSIAEYGSDVTINGQRLTMQRLRLLEQELGFRIAPGNYLFNAYNQCWANLTTGQAGCLGGAYISGRGSGEWNGRGDWSSWSDYGGGVGGTADGCIYAGDWSNC